MQCPNPLPMTAAWGLPRFDVCTGHATASSTSPAAMGSKKAIHTDIHNNTDTDTDTQQCMRPNLHSQTRTLTITNPPCDIPLRCCFLMGPRTVTRSSLRMLRRVAAFCQPLRPVLLLVSFPRPRSPVVGVLGLCRLRRVPFVRQWCPVVGAPRSCWWLLGSFDCFFCPRTSALWSSTTCFAAFPCA